jgi:hypothetical protein
MKRGELLDVVASLSPVSDPELEGRQRSPEAQALFEQIIQGPVDAPSAGRRRRRVSLRRRRVAVGALAIALGCIVAIAGSIGRLTEHHETQSQSALSRVLLHAASVARTQPVALPARGQLVREKVLTASLVSFPQRAQERRSHHLLALESNESWRGVSGGLLRSRQEQPVFPTEADAKAWPESDQTTGFVGTQSKRRLAALRPLRLPTSPTELYRRLSRTSVGRQEGASSLFLRLGRLLAAENASPPQRATLFAVLRRLPGIELLGPVGDPLGRRGVGVAIDDSVSHVRAIIIFDPTTSSVLARVKTTLPGSRLGYPPGTTIGYTVYVSRALTSARRLDLNGP